MIVPDFDRPHDDEYSDDGSNNFHRFFVPQVDSIHLGPKKQLSLEYFYVDFRDFYDFVRLTCNSQRCNLI